MTNFIILQIQGYKPTNMNLMFIWDLISTIDTDTDIRRRLDHSFDLITLESDHDTQEIAFQIAFNSLVYHFRLYCGEKRIKDFDVMKYVDHDSVYRITTGRKRISYFSKISKLPELYIR